MSEMAEIQRPTNRIDWYRVHVDPQVMKELNQTSDWRGLKQAGGHVGLTLVLAVGVFLVFDFLNTYVAQSETYWAFLSYLILLPLLWFYGNIAGMLHAGVHELIHERVFTSAWLNKTFVCIAAFLTWWNHRFFQLSHNEHHKHTLHQPDDLEVTLPQGMSPMWFVHAFLIKPMPVYHQFKAHINFARGKDWNSWQQYIMENVTPEQRRWVLRWEWMLVGGHAAIIIASLAAGIFVNPNFLIIPFLTSFLPMYGGLVAMLTGTPQHIGLVDQVNDFRLCCRTFRCNRFYEFLYWNMNFHIEHHMYPVVPCYNLPKLHEAIKHELPYTPRNLWECWVQIAYITDRQSREPEYQYRAPLPTDEHPMDPADAIPGTKPVKHIGAASTSAQEGGETEIAKVWECKLCGFIYDEAEGLPSEGIAAGTAWDAIPEDWICPVCGVAKTQFQMIEITREVAQTKQRTEIDTHADPIVIVGSGIAGYGIAREVRKHNPEQPVVIITCDGGESYYKPLLSNALSENKHADDLVLHDHQHMANELNATVMTHTTVQSIDREAKTLTTNTETLKYHKLVLALGADPITLPLQGSATDRVLSVNDLDDFRRFSQALTPSATVLLIGGGLIGCEFANDLAVSGHPVHVVDIADAPLGRLLPPRQSGQDAMHAQRWHGHRSRRRAQRGGPQAAYRARSSGWPDL